MELFYTLFMMALLIGLPVVAISDLGGFDKLIHFSKRKVGLLEAKTPFDELKEALQGYGFNERDRQDVISIIKENRNRCWKVSKVKALKIFLAPQGISVPEREQIDDARVFEHIQRYRDAQAHVQIAARYKCSRPIDLSTISSHDQQELEEIYWNELYRFVVKTIDSCYMSIEAKESSARSAREISEARRELTTDPYAEDFKQLGT